jgi:hypothetical protein
MTTVRAALAVALLYVSQAALLRAQTDVNGEWAATIAAPRGVLEYTMYLKQEGPRVTGYFQSEYGEIPLKGSIKDDTITLSWTLPDAKESIDCTMIGTVKGETISGDATLAKVGKGSFRAERTAS